MINMADQINVMANDLVTKFQGTKKLTVNGNPTYKISLEALLDLGFNRSKLLVSAKDKGIRLNKNEQFVIKSYNLRSDIISFLNDSI